jgi:ubiquinone/menaquinone biosynthesis C-methylase UbiE
MQHHLPIDSYQAKAAFFDSQIDAPWASEEYGPREYAKLNRLRAELGSLSGGRVLEPGCGSGRLTEVLSDWVGPAGRVEALDISPKMVARARQRLAGRDNVNVAHIALEDLVFTPSSFDVVLHHQVFPHYHDPARALRITARALRPGGSVVVIHFIPMAEINDTHRKAGTAVENDMIPPPDQMHRLFAEAGLMVNFIKNDELGFFLSGCPERGQG